MKSNMYQLIKLIKEKPKPKPNIGNHMDMTIQYNQSKIY